MKSHLAQAKGSSHYFSGRLSVGVVLTEDKKAILIDSGIDKGTAKEVDKAVKKMGARVSAIINTHFHADHCGGNHYFQKEYKELEILATKYEAAFIENAYMEPSCFCGGAEPLKDLRQNKLITIAAASKVTTVIDPYRDQQIVVCGVPLHIFTLPGHTPGMIGVRTPDNIFYCGDAVFGHETYDKHSILFYTNIQDTMATFKKLASLPMDGCVYYHGGFQPGNLTKVAEIHGRKVMDAIRFVLSTIKKEQQSLDELTRKVVNRFDIPKKIENFTLTRTCVNAYVACLEANGNIYLNVVDGLQVVGYCQTGKPTLFGEPLEIEIFKNELAEHKNEHKKEEMNVMAMRHLINYKMDILETDHKAETSSLKFSVGFAKNLSGDIHTDAFTLMEIEDLINLLKYKNLVKSEQTPIRFDASFTSAESNGIDSNYKDKTWGKLATHTPIQQKITGVILYPDHLEVTITDIPSRLMHSYPEVLANVLNQVRLSAYTSGPGAAMKVVAAL